ncbi:XdhC family protein [Sphingobium bisphenolivorans]|uniref:XdhC family protein n=1 Tax=Sphingobium bisphenolivorans TaxID=1335760 RepID=UPI00039A9AAE|nr:XdhC family protein [Sphingobium bisphenolivorans]
MIRHGCLFHPEDVAKFAIEAVRNHRGAVLIFVTGTGAGGVRAPGLRMAVDGAGRSIGYVSNGCVEADIVSQALEALAAGAPRAIAYGEGSPNIDIRLPCGGRLDILAVPLGDEAPLIDLVQLLDARTIATMDLGADGSLHAAAERSATTPAACWRFRIVPKIRLFVMGSGQETVLLAKMAAASDMQVQAYSPDTETVALISALSLPVAEARGLASPAPFECDPLTAVALMFHDHEWELKILQEMLSGPAFYIGALGSVRANQRRTQLLRDAAMPAELISRLKAPIGLIPRLRDPNLLAISVLAEVTAEFQRKFDSF